MADLDILNSALDKLGVERIQDITENTRQRVLLEGSYDRLRKARLRQHSWRFATKRVTSTENGNTPDSEFTYEHDLETDYLRFLDVPSNYKCKEEFYQVENKVILTNLETFIYRYIYDVTDVDQMTEDFKELLAYDLAVEHCYALTQSNSVKNTLLMERKEYMIDTKNINAQESRSYSMTDDLWLNARN